MAPLLTAAIIFFTSLAHATTIDENAFPASNIIEKDVAIIGGGASGTYAAVRLREDYDKSIILIERDDHLGGHVNTYIEPETNTPVDYGVLQYWDYGPAKAFFARMGVEIGTGPPDLSVTTYVDVFTDKNLTDYALPNFRDILESIQTYGNVSEMYAKYLLPGYWDFPEGKEIPGDLLLPFGEFAEKYGVEDFYPLIAVICGVGVGGVRDLPSLYVLGFGLGLPAIQGILQGTSFIPKSMDNSELYEKAYTLLEEDILLRSSVIQASRKDDATVLLVVQNADGTKYLIKAGQLLVTFAPTSSNLASLSIDATEAAVFKYGKPRPLYIGLVRTSIIPRNNSIQYISPLAAPDNYLDLYENFPYNLEFRSVGPEGKKLFRVLLETNYTLSVEAAQSLIRGHLKGLSAAGVYDDPKSCSCADVEFVEFTNHDSIFWRAPAEAIEGGFMKDLYGLQGRRRTWYTGSLWATDFSSNVWAFTDTVLERMVG